MSTNYYWKPSLLNPHRSLGRLHIGKRAGGWSFMFQGYENAYAALSASGSSDKALSLKTWDDWKVLLATPGVIYNEYDEKLSLEDFLQIVEVHFSPTSEFNGRPVLNHTTHLRTDARYKDNPVYHTDTQYWIDPQGYSFSIGNFS